jgi:hypothetical protein
VNGEGATQVKNNNDSNALAAGLLVIFAGAVLLSSPRCERGCRTVGEHLVTHGLEAILGLWGL